MGGTNWISTGTTGVRAAIEFGGSRGGANVRLKTEVQPFEFTELPSQKEFPLTFGEHHAFLDSFLLRGDRPGPTAGS